MKLDDATIDRLRELGAGDDMLKGDALYVFSGGWGPSK